MSTLTKFLVFALICSAYGQSSCIGGESECITQKDCGWTGSTCTACNTFSSKLDECVTIIGCSSFSTTCNSCLGAASSACEAYLGCTFVGTTCAACNTISNEATCTSSSKCGYSPSTCKSCSLVSLDYCPSYKGCGIYGSMCEKCQNIPPSSCPYSKSCGLKDSTSCASCNLQTLNNCLSYVGCGISTGNCVSCENISRSSCLSAQGCGYNADQCASCSLYDQTSCTTALGCGKKGGECISCSTIQDSSDCKSIDGCGYSGTCTDCKGLSGSTCTNANGCALSGSTCTTCARIFDETECKNAAGCGFGSGKCQDCELITDETNCLATVGCGFNTATNACSSCAKTSAADCATTRGCGLSGSTCESCSLYNKETCTAATGCGYATSCGACSTIGSNVSTCQSHKGCGISEGRCIDCTLLDETKCKSSADCVFETQKCFDGELEEWTINDRCVNNGFYFECTCKYANEVTSTPDMVCPSEDFKDCNGEDYEYKNNGGIETCACKYSTGLGSETSNYFCSSVNYSFCNDNRVVYLSTGKCLCVNDPSKVVTDANDKTNCPDEVTNNGYDAFAFVNDPNLNIDDTLDAFTDLCYLISTDKVSLDDETNRGHTVTILNRLTTKTSYTDAQLHNALYCVGKIVTKVSESNKKQFYSLLAKWIDVLAATRMPSEGKLFTDKQFIAIGSLNDIACVLTLAELRSYTNLFAVLRGYYLDTTCSAFTIRNTMPRTTRRDRLNEVKSACYTSVLYYGDIVTEIYSYENDLSGSCLVVLTFDQVKRNRACNTCPTTITSTNAANLNTLSCSCTTNNSGMLITKIENTDEATDESGTNVGLIVGIVVGVVVLVAVVAVGIVCFIRRRRASASSSSSAPNAEMQSWNPVNGETSKPKKASGSGSGSGSGSWF